MKAITLRVISVFVALVIGSALYTATLTRIQYTATFTVTPDDRAYTETELATIREGAQTAFSLKEKQDVGAFEGKPTRFVVKLCDVTREDLMWMLSQQLSESMSPRRYGGPEDPDMRTKGTHENIAVRCVPYLSRHMLALMTLGLANVFLAGWLFAQAGRNSDRKGSQEKPQPPPGN